MQASDVEHIGELWAQFVAYHRTLDDALPVAAPDGPQRYARSLLDRLDDSHTRVYVALEAGEIVGYILGVLVDLLPEMFEQERAGFVADMFVLPDYRGRGLGRGLVNAMKDWFRALGVTHYEWYVASANRDGIAFWRAVGGRDVMIRMRASLDEDET